VGRAMDAGLMEEILDDELISFWVHVASFVVDLAAHGAMLGMVVHATFDTTHISLSGNKQTEVRSDLNSQGYASLSCIPTSATPPPAA